MNTYIDTDNTTTNEGYIERHTIEQTVAQLVGREYQYGLFYEDNFDDSYRHDEILSAVLETLTPREKEVVTARFFKLRTLREVGLEIGVNQERVRQIEARALRKLRHPERLKPLLLLAEVLGIAQYDDEPERKKESFDLAQLPDIDASLPDWAKSMLESAYA